MNPDLYDPGTTPPARVTRHLTKSLTDYGSRYTEANAVAERAKERFYDAIEAAHGATVQERRQGFLSAPAIAALVGLSKVRVQQILSERKAARIEADEAREAARAAADAEA
jgi:hypothetical protein